MDDSLINKEVFIVVSGYEEDEACEIYFTSDLPELKQCLSEMVPDTSDDVRIYHGVLQSAKYISELPKNSSIFIVCLDKHDLTVGCIIESCSVDMDELSEELSIVFGTYDINDVFILYGYQLQVCLSINENEINKEIISKCRSISDNVELVKTAAGENYG